MPISPRIIRRKALRMFLIVFLIIFIATLLGFFFPDILGISGYVQAVLEFISMIVAVLMLVDELKDTQRLEEASFIMDLNTKFVENTSCNKVFAYAIQEINDRKLNDSSLVNEQERELLIAFTAENPQKPLQVDISNYLTFFESIFLLIDQQVISWETLNELFKYRFFACVHSNFIQEARLIRIPSNFKNLLYFEALWIQYNGNDPTKIAEYDNRLENACKKAGKSEEYNKIINDMETKKHRMKEMEKKHPKRKG